MLKQGYQVKAYNKATRKTAYYNYKDKANAQAKARELRKDPNIGISIYKVTRGGQHGKKETESTEELEDGAYQARR